MFTSLCGMFDVVFTHLSSDFRETSHERETDGLDRAGLAWPGDISLATAATHCDLSAPCPALRGRTRWASTDSRDTTVCVCVCARARVCVCECVWDIKKQTVVSPCLSVSMAAVIHSQCHQGWQSTWANVFRPCFLSFLN